MYLTPSLTLLIGSQLGTSNGILIFVTTPLSLSLFRVFKQCYSSLSCLGSSPWRQPLTNPSCVHVCVLSRVRLIGIPWTVAHQALLSMEFSRQESWSGLPCHLLLQVICLIQAGIKPMPLGLLRWQVDSLPLTNPSATSIYCLCFQCILNVLSYLLQE